MMTSSASPLSLVLSQLGECNADESGNGLPHEVKAKRMREADAKAFAELRESINRMRRGTYQ
jgi:hypothetical protein